MYYNFIIIIIVFIKINKFFIIEMGALLPFPNIEMDGIFIPIIFLCSDL